MKALIFILAAGFTALPYFAGANTKESSPIHLKDIEVTKEVVIEVSYSKELLIPDKQIVVTVKGHYHPNGGGFVANTAYASLSAYIGKDSMVLDHARVEGPDVMLIGTARVYGNARVYGAARISNGQVFGNAQVYGYAEILGASVYGSAQVYDQAQVYYGVKVFDHAQVFGNARILGKSSVSVFGYSEILDFAIVEGTAQIYGNAKIWGHAKVKDAHVFGSAQVYDYASVNGEHLRGLEDDILIAGVTQVYKEAVITKPLVKQRHFNTHITYNDCDASWFDSCDDND